MNNQTINRLYKQDGNLLLNPFFEVYTPPSTGEGLRASRYSGLGLDALHNIPLQGWHLFGLVHGGNASAFWGAPTLDSPFESPSSGVNPSVRAGVAQISSTGYVTGLIQKIPKGSQLIGRKVRISGSYNVALTSLNANAGISIWLKGKVHRITASGAPRFSSVAGDTVGASPVLTDLTSPGFLSVAVGDTVVISGQSSVSAGLFEAAAGAAATTLPVSNPGGFDFTDTGLSYWVSDSGHTPIFPTGIRIDHGLLGEVPGYVVKMSDSLGGANYNIGPERLNRFTDGLRAVSSDTSVTPDQSTDAASFLYFGGYLYLGSSFSTSEKNVLGPAGWWQGAAPPSTDLWLLDSSDWSNVAADGNLELFSEVQTPDTTVHYFEEIVEIPADFLADEGDIWVVVMNHDPRSQPHLIGAPAHTNFYALTLELLPEDSDPAGDSIAGRLHKNSLNNMFGDMGRELSIRDILREPIWEPARYPIDTGLARGNGTFTVFAQGNIAAPFETYGVHLAGTAPGEVWVPIPGVPFGAIVTGLTLEYRTRNVNFGEDYTTGLTVELWQVFSQGASGPDRRQLIVAGTRAPILDFPDSSSEGTIQTQVAGSNPAMVLVPIHRHRVGEYVSSASTVDIGDLVGASLWVRLEANGDVAVCEMLIRPGYIDVLQDPRLKQAQWAGLG